MNIQKLISLNRIKEKLWFRPTLFCIISVISALISHLADETNLATIVPNIKIESIEGLLNTISSSMLVISIFVVASMLSAFTAASNSATPRSFKLVVTDDVSQNALSVFIGAFIFSIVATVALDNGYYGKAGKFTLFFLTIVLFAAVILTFLRWVDRISRLGRMDHTIAQVEKATQKSLSSFIENPYLNALPLLQLDTSGSTIYSNSTGYIQHISIKKLQKIAEDFETKIQITHVQGDFITENTAIAYLSTKKDIEINDLTQRVNEAIHTDDTRIFEEDPRFGFTALTEIATRALSPGINDPGTAIQVIGSQERLFFLWNKIKRDPNKTESSYNRVEIKSIAIDDFGNSAFKPIARNGADDLEVMLRLQQAFSSLATINNEKIVNMAKQNSKEAYERAEIVMKYKKDLQRLKDISLFNTEDS